MRLAPARVYGSFDLPDAASRDQCAWAYPSSRLWTHTLMLTWMQLSLHISSRVASYTAAGTRLRWSAVMHMPNGAEHDRPQLHAAPTICNFAFIQQILDQLPAGRAACTQRNIHAHVKSLTTHRIWLSSGRREGAACAAHDVSDLWRGLTCPAGASPQCCRQCPALHAGLQQW